MASVGTYRIVWCVYVTRGARRRSVSTVRSGLHPWRRLPGKPSMIFTSSAANAAARPRSSSRSSLGGYRIFVSHTQYAVPGIIVTILFFLFSCRPWVVVGQAIPSHAEMARLFMAPCQNGQQRWAVVPVSCCVGTVQYGLNIARCRECLLIRRPRGSLYSVHSTVK